jgi:ESCRT-II complex subunit VPS22
MRRRIGVKGRAEGLEAYRKKAQEMKTISYQSAVETVEKLERKLTDFAVKHKQEIQTDAAFRSMFLQMCAPLGVDPLVSSKKKSTKGGGLWASLGLGLEEFYAELSVKVAEVCIATRSSNGGLIAVREVKRRLQKRGTKFNLSKVPNESTQVSEDDIITAASKLSALGSGFRTVQIGGTTMIVSVPFELDSDHMEVMHIALHENASKGGEEQKLSSNSHCEAVGQVTLQDVINQTGWDADRCQRALDLLLSEGIAWIDIHKGVTRYWFPSVIKEWI